MGQFIILFLLISFIIVRIGYARQVCETETCKGISNEFTMGMDPSTTACNDFYGHMCGGWKRNHPIPDDEESIDTLSFLDDRLDMQIIDILTNTSIKPSTNALKTARKLYNSCMDVVTFDGDGPRNLLDFLKKNGGWLLLSPEPVFTPKTLWQTYLLMDYQLLRPEPLFVVETDLHILNFAIQIINIKQPELILSETVIMDEKSNNALLRAYKKYIQDVAFYLSRKSGKCKPQLFMERDIDEMIEFELKLAKIREFSLCKMKGECVYRIMTIEGLQNWYNTLGGDDPSTRIDWLAIIQHVFQVTELKIKKSDMVQISNVEFFEKLPNLLKETKARTIANYIAWTVIHYGIDFSGRSLTTIKNEFFIKVKDKSYSKKEREITCLRHPNLEKAISFEYVKRYVPTNYKSEVRKIIDHILLTYEDSLSKISWMDLETRQKSIEKLQAMKIFVAYPDDYSSANIDNYYKKFKLGSNYLESVMNIEKFKYSKALNELREPVSRDEWYTEPTTINAAYQRTTNSFTVTAAILQPPIFDPERPQVLNYGAIGYIIAHEISHAFDDRSCTLGKDGNLEDWWPPLIYEIYKQKVFCFVEQFKKYEIKEASAKFGRICTNGELTLSENIADSTALQIAYFAYKDYQKKIGGIDIRLVNLEDVSSDRLFFMIFAYTKCSNIQPEKLLFNNFKECHACPEARVRGSISNHENFAFVYQCKIFSKMNPLKKCSILK
ncbi:membrane metallo-endopeptidase-like 1 [Prorops nasuta]|uniref:membrane metallo-endopeptidase-like 1 n=1 Tax=Prorops nasuta TaxID=863751 RepID=UPI0034CE2BF1